MLTVESPVIIYNNERHVLYTYCDGSEIFGSHGIQKWDTRFSVGILELLILVSQRGTEKN